HQCLSHTCSMRLWLGLSREAITASTRWRVWAAVEHWMPLMALSSYCYDREQTLRPGLRLAPLPRMQGNDAMPIADRSAANHIVELFLDKTADKGTNRGRYTRFLRNIFRQAQVFFANGRLAFDQVTGGLLGAGSAHLDKAAHRRRQHAIFSHYC